MQFCNLSVFQLVFLCSCLLNSTTVKTHVLSGINAPESSLDKTSMYSKNDGVKLASEPVQAKQIFQFHFRHLADYNFLPRL